MNNNNNNIRLDDKFMQVNIVLHKIVHFKNSFLFDFFFCIYLILLEVPVESVWDY